MPGIECNIKDLRQDKGWTLSQLAQYAGINKGRVSEIENGVRRPTRAEKCKLEDALDFEIRQWVSVPPRD